MAVALREIFLIGLQFLADFADGADRRRFISAISAVDITVICEKQNFDLREPVNLDDFASYLVLCVKLTIGAVNSAFLFHHIL